MVAQNKMQWQDHIYLYNKKLSIKLERRGEQLGR